MDAKSISTSIIKKGDRKNCIALYDFSLSRFASARGGYHAFVRYYEGTYDPYFRSTNLDWSIIKQTDRQCMLLFCDRLLYCLCPFLALAVFFYMGVFIVMAYLIQ